MATKPESRIAFWLLPASKDSFRLQRIIETYAKRLGTPSFEPHLTLLALPSIEIDDPYATLNELTTSAAPFSLRSSGTPQWGATYNQAFVLPFILSPELSRLVERLHPQRTVPPGYFPHISLIYANLSRDAGEHLQKEFSPSVTSILFDRCAAVRIGPHCQCDNDVFNWEPVATAQLT